MATKLWAVILVFLCTALTSSAQIFYKFGAEKLPVIFTNWPLLAGFFLYGIGAVILIIALKGGELSVLYPIISTSYVWVALLSVYFFNDSLNFFKMAGIFAIIAGITFIGFGSKKNSALEYTEVP